MKPDKPPPDRRCPARSGGQVRAGFPLDKTFHCVLCADSQPGLDILAASSHSDSSRATWNSWCFTWRSPAVGVTGCFCIAMIYRFGVAAGAEML